MALWSRGCCFYFMSALQNTRALLPCCIQAGATAVTVENPPEHGKGLQRSLKGAGDSAFCSSAVLAGWEFVLVLSRDFLTRILHVLVAGRVLYSCSIKVVLDVFTLSYPHPPHLSPSLIPQLSYLISKWVIIMPQWPSNCNCASPLAILTLIFGTAAAKGEVCFLLWQEPDLKRYIEQLMTVFPHP